MRIFRDFLKTLKLAIVLTWNAEAKIIAVILGIHEVLTVFFGWYIEEYLQGKQNMHISLLVLIVMGVIVISMLVRNYSLINRGGRAQQIDRHTVVLHEGDYVNNMRKIIRETNVEQLKSYNFVMGIDRTGDLAKATTSGTLYGVLVMLEKLDGLPNGAIRKEIQRKINEAWDKERDAEGYLPYGACVSFEVKLLDGKSFYMTFVANSEHKYPDAKIGTSDFNLIRTDSEKGRIFSKLFLHLHSIDCEQCIVIGAIGTKGLAFDYQETISLILTHFYVSMHDLKWSKHLIICTGKGEYKKNGLTISDLQQYIIASAKFYKQKR